MNIRSLGVRLVLGVSVALAGCGSGGNPTPDTGGMTDGGGGNDVQGNPDTTGTDVVGTDVVGTDAPVTSNCSAQATATCTQFAHCNMVGFQLAFENMATCVSVLTARCSAPALMYTHGVMNQAMCSAMLNDSTSCNAFFSAVPPMACRRAPGDRMIMESCQVDAQCGAGLYCYNSTGGCPNGACDMASSIGSSCTTSHDCDSDNGVACVNTFDMMMGMTTDGASCQTVTYGAMSAPCFPGTQKQCGPGFACAAATRHCVPALTAGSPCTPADGLCDTRFGLRCAPDMNGNNICQGPTFVPVGAQCGTVMGVMQTCSAYAICNSATPSVCEMRKTMGQPCTSTPDNCFPGLACMAGTCQAPTPPTC